MRLLLDTHTAIWFFNDDDRLSKKATQSILSPSNDRLLIVSSISENMPIITADTNIRLYPVDYIW
ncbi:hypothetical protein FACS189496_3240 [Bacilli bacterium]|nr:hypothetical protein FACS189496_3240 [Bacilli bacterium]